MNRAILGLLVPGMLVAAGGTALVVATTGANIASDISARASTVLEKPEYSWASLSLDMRDAAIAGTATTQQSIDAVIAELAAVPGLRSVASEVVLAERRSPYPLSARIVDGAVEWGGGVPDEATRTRLVEQFGRPQEDLQLYSGAPDRAAYDRMLDFVLSVLAHLDQGTLDAEDLDLRIAGRAASVADFAALADLRQAGPPEGVRLLRLDIQPPHVEPYTVTARFDGTTMALSGYAPDNRQAAILAGLDLPGATIAPSLLLASGEPDNYLENITFLVRSLARLDTGEATFGPDGMVLTGEPPDAETAAAIRTAFAERGATVELAPPRVADYRLEAGKSPSGLTFQGVVPDDVTLTRLGQTDRADTSGLSLARGAPERFAATLDLGLGALRRMSEGRFVIDEQGISVTGRAASAADFDALEAALGPDLPQGVTLSLADIRPPLAQPYAFSADKSADGTVTLAGHLPTRAERDAVSQQFQGVDGNLLTVADGAPEGFVAAAGHAAELLPMLASGRIAYDGTGWVVAGAVDDPVADLRLRRYFAAEGLAAQGWTYSVALPAAPRAASRPIIDPYVWRAQKTANGSISFAGFVPSESFRRVALIRAGANAEDAATLGAGAPAGFAADALAGLDALRLLDEGLLGYSAGNWSLSGKTATRAESEAVRQALAGRTDPAHWQLAVQALDAPPVASPYTFLAIKPAGGTVALSGHLLSEDLRNIVLIKAGDGAIDKTVLATGEPFGFVADLLAGLDGLALLEEGRLAFDGTRWSLSGRAPSAERRDAIEAVLDNGARRLAGWDRAIRIPIVAEPAPEPVAVAEAAPPEPTEPAAETPPVPEAPQPPPEPEPQPEPELQPEVPAPEPAPEPEPAPQPAAPPEPEPVPEPVAAPEPEPALPEQLDFEVARNASGALVARGSVPDANLVETLEAKGVTAPEPLAVDPELPADFATRIDAGLAAIEGLFDGRFGYGEGMWVIEGRARQAEDRHALMASVATITPGDWQTGIEVVPPLELCQVRVDAVAARNAILFRSGSDALTDQSLPVLDELAGYLAVCPDTIVQVEGHTDSDGAEDLNLALSVARAEAVVFALMDRGIDLDRLYAMGYGESLPIADNDTPAGKQRNRRIAFKVLEDDR